jgi:hypothetical protein
MLNTMEESNGVFDGMSLEPTVNDLFWKEKTQRMINECTSVSQLREISSLLLDIATKRQGVICGLMKKILLETKGPSLTLDPVFKFDD